MPGLERRLKAELTGDVRFDPFTRGRYATDASHYQITPVGVVVPRTIEEADRAIAIARAEKVTVLPRGGGTSQCGQTVGPSLVVDCSKYLNRILDLDVAGRRVAVEPGIVLDDLNRQLKKHGLWYPVDISTASRATIGGMAGNNSCGGRSLRYGTMRDNVVAIDAILANGTKAHFGRIGRAEDAPEAIRPLARDLLAIGARDMVMKTWPSTATLYRGARLADAAGAGLQVTVNPARTPDSLVVNGKITNTASSAREIPRLRVALRDDHNAEVASQVIDPPRNSLAPGATTAFSTVFKNPDSAATGVAVTFAAQ